ncbi:hypothetical protein JOB18_007016 [Solea senegalensis]|uniref:Uncharacterized protein n=1 Tax=Solea senegalensis TaxID=28829 RepID=A0AAV6QZK3_SOLSE|nr:hypothetical protein JOB18_007016 [Solea senegalensis]
MKRSHQDPTPIIYTPECSSDNSLRQNEGSSGERNPVFFSYNMFFGLIPRVASHVSTDVSVCGNSSVGGDSWEFNVKTQKIMLLKKTLQFEEALKTKEKI